MSNCSEPNESLLFPGDGPPSPSDAGDNSTQPIQPIPPIPYGVVLPAFNSTLSAEALEEQLRLEKIRQERHAKLLAANHAAIDAEEEPDEENDSSSEEEEDSSSKAVEIETEVTEARSLVSSSVSAASAESAPGGQPVQGDPASVQPTQLELALQQVAKLKAEKTAWMKQAMKPKGYRAPKKPRGDATANPDKMAAYQQKKEAHEARINELKATKDEDYLAWQKKENNRRNASKTQKKPSTKQGDGASLGEVAAPEELGMSDEERAKVQKALDRAHKREIQKCETYAKNVEAAAKDEDHEDHPTCVNACYARREGLDKVHTEAKTALAKLETLEDYRLDLEYLQGEGVYEDGKPKPVADMWKLFLGLVTEETAKGRCELPVEELPEELVARGTISHGDAALMQNLQERFAKGVKDVLTDPNYQIALKNAGGGEELDAVLNELGPNPSIKNMLAALKLLKLPEVLSAKHLEGLQAALCPLSPLTPDSALVVLARRAFNDEVDYFVKSEMAPMAKKARNEMKKPDVGTQVVQCINRALESHQMMNAAGPDTAAAAKSEFETRKRDARNATRQDGGMLGCEVLKVKGNLTVTVAPTSELMGGELGKKMQTLSCAAAGRVAQEDDGSRVLKGVQFALKAAYARGVETEVVTATTFVGGLLECLTCRQQLAIAALVFAAPGYTAFQKLRALSLTNIMEQYKTRAARTAHGIAKKLRNKMPSHKTLAALPSIPAKANFKYNGNTKKRDLDTHTTVVDGALGDAEEVASEQGATKEPRPQRIRKPYTRFDSAQEDAQKNKRKGAKRKKDD